MNNTKQIIKVAMWILLGIMVSAMSVNVFVGMGDSTANALAAEAQEIMEEFRAAKAELKTVQIELAEKEATVEFWRTKRDENTAKQNAYINEAIIEEEIAIAPPIVEVAVVDRFIEPVTGDKTKEDYLVGACNYWAKNANKCVDIMTGVFIADSSWCTQGQGARNLNCGNVRPGSGKYGDPNVEWTNSNNFRKYESIRDGISDNVALYVQLYEGKSLAYMKEYWAGNSENWKLIVSPYFYK